MHIVPIEAYRRRDARLQLGSAAAARAVRPEPAVVSIAPAFGAMRERVTTFIESRYRAAYGARMRVDYPHLVSVQDHAGALMAAAGFRIAGAAPLFVERYLERPVDEILGVERASIAEVGNLVSTGKGASIFLIAALAAHLDDAGLEHVAATVTTSLARRLDRLGLETKILGNADPACVAGARETWGSYYVTGPRVVAGRVDHAVRRLRTLFGEHFYRRRPRLYPALYLDAEVAQ